jgi:hypothetical protein
MRKGIVLWLLLFFLLSIIQVQGDTAVPPPKPSVSSSSSSSRAPQMDFDKIFKALQEGKDKKPQKFEDLKKLLYIKPFVTKDYDKNYTLGLTVIANDNETTNVTRNDKFGVWATVGNPNPIEIRRVMYVDLYALEPGEKSFRKVNSAPAMIMNNEYENKDGKNYSFRKFPELTSFSNIKTVGPAVLKIEVSDGETSWESNNYTLGIINRPPALENLSLEATKHPKFNDPIIYSANVSDLDEDLINVTLHILDAQHRELRNQTQLTMPGKTVSFIANQYGFFDREDSGKNFSYYYTFGDGIVANNTTILDGPNLRKSVSIWVGKPIVVPEDENQYWWQSYNFSLEMKNQDPGEASVTTSLFTDTEAHPWKAAGSQVVTLTQEPQAVYFNVKPFDVMDANQTFGFRFAYSETDQHGQNHIDAQNSDPINPKLVRYDFVSALGLANVLVLLILGMLVSIFVERRFYR